MATFENFKDAHEQMEAEQALGTSWGLMEGERALGASFWITEDHFGCYQDHQGSFLGQSRRFQWLSAFSRNSK